MEPDFFENNLFLGRFQSKKGIKCGQNKVFQGYEKSTQGALLIFLREVK